MNMFTNPDTSTRSLFRYRLKRVLCRIRCISWKEHPAHTIQPLSLSILEADTNKHDDAEVNNSDIWIVQEYIYVVRSYGHLQVKKEADKIGVKLCRMRRTTGRNMGSWYSFFVLQMLVVLHVSDKEWGPRHLDELLRHDLTLYSLLGLFDTTCLHVLLYFFFCAEVE